MPLSSDQRSYTRHWTWATYFTSEESPIRLSEHDTHDQDMADAISVLAARSFPAGGQTGQVLVKLSSADYDFGFGDQSGGGGGTDLDYVAATRTLTSNTGADVVLPEATDALAGLMSAADKAQLDSLDGATIPTGGTTDQILTKTGSADGAVGWRDAPTELPSGGTTGQTLTKTGSGDDDLSWSDPATELPTGGATGAFLRKSSSADGAVEWSDFATAGADGTVAQWGAGGVLGAATFASDAEMTAGTETAFRAMSPANIATAINAQGGLSVLHVSDTKPNNTDGGTATAGAWYTRVLNTEDANTLAGAGLVYLLDYDAQTANFTVGDTLTGGTSGATATIVADTDNGATGTLSVIGVTGTFVENEIVTGSSGGSATANNASSDDSGTGLDYANQLYLPAGDYVIEAASHVRATGSCRARLYDPDAASVIGLSASSFTINNANSSLHRQVVTSYFTTTVGVLLELQYRVEVNSPTNGLGRPANFGETEKYAEIFVWST